MPETLQVVCNIIILIGAAVGAIAGICEMIGKPFIFFKKIRQKNKDKENEKVAASITKKVKLNFDQQFKDIKAQNDQQSRNIDTLINAMQDSLGAELTNFYENRKDDAILSLDEQESLKDLYRAYKSVEGNHHGDLLWKKFKTWTVLDEKGRIIPNPDWTWEEEKKVG